MIKALILQERPLQLQEPPLANALSLQNWLSPNPASQVNRGSLLISVSGYTRTPSPLHLPDIIPGKPALVLPRVAGPGRTHHPRSTGLDGSS